MSAEEHAQKLLDEYLDKDNPEFINKLKKAETVGDIRAIIMAYTKPTYNLAALFSKDSPYANKVAKVISTTVIDDGGEEIGDVDVKKQVRIADRNIQVRRGRKTFYKSEGKKYSEKERLFIKQSIKRGMTARQLFEEYNARNDFTPRTLVALQGKRRDLK
jgi:hypothetical protein